MNTINKPLIVLVEDDKFQRGDYKSELEAVFPDAEVCAIACGVEFLDAYEKRPERIPDVFVIDLMLEWRKEYIKTTQRQMPQSSFEQAKTAMICYEAVRSYSPNVPIILWTKSDLKPRKDVVDSVKTFFWKKHRDIEGDVYNLIRKFLAARNY